MQIDSLSVERIQTKQINQTTTKYAKTELGTVLWFDCDFGLRLFTLFFFLFIVCSKCALNADYVFSLDFYYYLQIPYCLQMIICGFLPLSLLSPAKPQPMRILQQ